MDTEKLYMETERGSAPIDPATIKKYRLEKGMLSPFSRCRIVGVHGDFPGETTAQKIQTYEVKGNNPEKDGGGAQQNGGVTLTTSEIIDLAHGEDSSTGQ